MKSIKSTDFNKEILTTILLISALFPAQLAAQDNVENTRDLLLQMQKQLNDLKAENAAVRSELEQIKKNSATTTAAINGGDVVAASPGDGAITYDSKTGFIHFPGADTKVKFGGYIKGDAIYDFGTSRTGAGQDFFQPASIPLSGTAAASGDNFRLHARQTRANITAITKTGFGDLKLFVEGDFFGTEGSELVTNGHSIQLRHAYGELGPLLVGQTWSNWMDLDAYPETTDYVGPAGISLVRQGQIRYTHSITPNNKISVSVENPASLDVVANAGGTAIGSDDSPDFTARYTHSGDWGFVSLKGILRQIDLSTTNVAGGFAGSDEKWGYGVGIAGRFNTWGKDNFKYQIAYGDGLGRYVYDVAVSANAAIASGTTGDLELSEILAGYAAYQHHWNDQWRSNVIGGFTHIDSDGSIATVNEDIYSAEANLIWQPLPRYQTGLSYIYGYRETVGGQSGDLNRIMWSHWFLF